VQSAIIRSRLGKDERFAESMIFVGLDFGQILWFGDVDQGFRITTEDSYKATISSYLSSKKNGSGEY
jgi:hypothetical protein